MCEYNTSRGPLWPGNTFQVLQAWVRKSSVSRLINTNTSLLSIFSAQGTVVVSVIILHTYIGHRTTLGLSCCRQCSRGTPSVGETSSEINNARQQQRQRRQRHTHAWINGLGVPAASTPVARTQTTIPHHFGLLLLFSHSFFSCRQVQGRAGA